MIKLSAFRDGDTPGQRVATLTFSDEDKYLTFQASKMVTDARAEAVKLLAAEIVRTHGSALIAEMTPDVLRQAVQESITRAVTKLVESGNVFAGQA